VTPKTPRKLKPLSPKRHEQAITALWLDGFSFLEINRLLAWNGGTELGDIYLQQIIRRNVVLDRP